MTSRLYVSDVHLMPGDSTAERQRLTAFSNLLQSAPGAGIEEIYLLGDLCEMWIGDDDDSPLVSHLAALFADLSTKLAMQFLPGNRDFLLGQQFAQRTGLTIIDDPHRLTDGTVLSHGDSLCTDDSDYQTLRTLLRSSEWQKDILSKSLAERRAFGANLRAQSMTANANKASNIMDVNASAVTELVDQHNALVFIHGHTHRPGIHNVSANCQRLVLGAWEDCGWWALQQQQHIELRCAGISWLSRQSIDSLSHSKALTLVPGAPSETETRSPAQK